MRDAWARQLRGNRKHWLLGGVLLAVFVLIFWRDSIGERLVPDPRMNQTLDRARLALRKGELSSADGKGARELFESVLATDPDQMIARQGLVEVRNAAIARAEHALDQRRLLQARQFLELAEALSAPAVQVQVLRARLHMDADNFVALEARRSLHSRWLRQAESLLDSNRVASAQVLVDKVIAADPAHLDLPPVQAKLGEALARAQRAQARVMAQAAAVLVAEERIRQARMAQKSLLRPPTRDQRRQLPRLIAEAEEAMARGDFITPPGTSAWDKLRVASAISADSPDVLKLHQALGQASRACFEQAMGNGHLKRAQSCLEASLALDPVSAQTRDGMERLAGRWLAYAEERIGASDYVEAETAVAFARRWQPTHPLLKPTAERLQQARGTP